MKLILLIQKHWTPCFSFKSLEQNVIRNSSLALQWLKDTYRTNQFWKHKWAWLNYECSGGYCNMQNTGAQKSNELSSRRLSAATKTKIHYCHLLNFNKNRAQWLLFINLKGIITKKKTHLFSENSRGDTCLLLLIFYILIHSEEIFR